jgi:rhamnosyltransferase
MEIALIIPTYNAARHWQALYEGICKQSLRPDRVVVMDSSSTDDTTALARAAGFTVVQISRSDFTHGGTRQTAVRYTASADTLLYLTQDAVPVGTESFRKLVAAFHDPSIGAACGRQLPRPRATAIEAHARLFNYPPESSVRSLESGRTLGFKSIFFSNAFGAYRRDALMDIGGFSPYVNFGEDTVAVARMHCAGWKTAYVADALVEHSHNHSLWSEFERYFEIGVLHQREHWLIEQFGVASGEGKRFVLSEMRYLWRHDPSRVPSAVVRTLIKYLGYRAGRREKSPANRRSPRLSPNR